MKLSDAAANLMRRGVDIPTISECLDLNPDDLEQLRLTLDITIVQDDVVEAMNRLAWRAYEEAINMLKSGTPAVRLNIIRMMLSSMRGLMGSQSPKEMAGLIADFKRAIEVADESPDADDEIEDVDDDDES